MVFDCAEDHRGRCIKNGLVDASINTLPVSYADWAADKVSFGRIPGACHICRYFDGNHGSHDACMEIGLL